MEGFAKLTEARPPKKEISKTARGAEKSVVWQPSERSLFYQGAKSTQAEVHGL